MVLEAYSSRLVNAFGKEYIKEIMVSSQGQTAAKIRKKKICRKNDKHNKTRL